MRMPYIQMLNAMNDRELLWSQYKQNVDLYKFYMELLLKLETFYYAITGAIFSYYFSNVGIPEIKYSLFLPLIMSVAFAGFFIYGAVLISITREETFKLRDALGLQVAPDLGVLSVLLYIFAIISLLVAAVSGYVLWCK